MSKLETIRNFRKKIEQNGKLKKKAINKIKKNNKN